MTPRRPGGFFITFEGGEGAGKSTQVGLLSEGLRLHGYRTLVTREPGGSPHAEALRKVLLSGQFASLGATFETVCFAAARIDHLDKTIRPALADGAIVICDRFIDSTRAYQGTLGKVDRGLIALLERVTMGPTRPDLTLILDVPEKVGMARAAKRRETGETADRFEREGRTYHARLRRAFRAIAGAEPERCVLIPASKPVAVVAETIWQTVAARLAIVPPPVLLAKPA